MFIHVDERLVLAVQDGITMIVAWDWHVKACKGAVHVLITAAIVTFQNARTAKAM